MTTLIEILSGPIWQQILLTLAHSLWQGVVLALLLAVVLSQLNASRPQMRYALSLATLVTLVVSSAVTWSVLDLPRPHLKPLTDKLEQSDDSRPPASGDSLVLAASTATNLQDQPIPHASATTANPVINLQTTASALCVAAWLSGVATMLARMVWLVAGTRRLALRPAITDRRVLDLVEALRRRLGIRRSIRAIDSASIGPAVLGILRPVLLLPAAIVTELPPDCLEAILAHELAHICRHDYLVNLVQMLIEAALFFNPAIWWISRQIRREREACCDALAVGITGQPLTYAQALAAWLERMHAAQFSPATAAWLGQGQRGTVLDRVRRLVIAGYRPELRGSWTALAAGLVLSALALAALWTGTRASVALAADILSPRERLERLAEGRAEMRPLADSRAKATLSGTVRTADGRALPATLNANVDTKNESSGLCGIEMLTTPAFALQVPWGRTWLSVSVPDYAPIVLGPFETKPGETLDGLEIVFEPGFTSQLQLVDGHGLPVAGAIITAMPNGPDSGVPQKWQGDERGLVTAEHLAAFAYKLAISAPGFQTLRPAPLTFLADKTLTQTLTAARPTRGVVVSPQGTPIAGAEIRCVASMIGSQSIMDGNLGPVMATSDDEGHFTIDRLNDDTIYALRVETSDYGWQLFPNIRAGQADLRWVAGPDFTVTGTIVGDVGKLTSRRGSPRLDYSQRCTMAGAPGVSFSSEFLSTNGEAEVTLVDGEWRFRLKDLLPGTVSIRAGTRRFDFALEKPTNDVTIDLDETRVALPTRHVVLRFIGADAGVAPEGEVSISMTKASPVADQQSSVAIKNGIVEFDAYVPGRIHYAMKNVVGYWFERGVVQVPVGTAALEHDVPVVAAGAIRGRLLNANGKPAGGNARVAARATEKPPGISIDPLGVYDVPVEGSGEFFVSPLPLGGVYVVKASRGFENAMSEPVRVDADHPISTVKVRFSTARDVRGRLLGPDGQPLSEHPVNLVFDLAGGGTNYLPPNPTDRDGRFEFSGLSAGIGQYLARIKPRRDFQPADAQLPLDGQPINIQLKAGHVIEGRLLDAATSEPLAGIPLFAIPNQGGPLKPFRYDAEEPTTDANGWFRFSTLPEGKFRVFAGCPLTWQSPAEELTAHTGESIELRASKPIQK